MSFSPHSMEGRRAGRASALRRLSSRTALRPAIVLALFPLLTSCVYWTPRSLTPASSAAVLSGVPLQKWDILSCGAGALSSVLQHHGDPTTMDDWDTQLPKTRGGVLSIDLVLAARGRGFDASMVAGDVDLLAAEVRDGRPVILMLQVVQAPGRGYDFFHYIVVDGHDAERGLLRVQFGDARARWVRPDRLLPAWRAAGFAAILIRPADPSREALRTAVRLEEQGDLARAADEYRAIALEHGSPLAWTNLGNARLRLGQRTEAEEAFRRAIDLEPASADALNNLAWLLFEQKRFDEAEPLARQAAAIAAPDRWMRLDTLARILAARGSCEEARRIFERAIESLPPERDADREMLRTAAADCGGRDT